MTSASNQTSTTLSPIDVYLSYIRIPSIATQLCLWGFLFTLVIGFTGNTLSLLTFCRPTLKNISTGCFFILLAISDMSRLCIFMIDFLEYGIQIRFYHHLDYDAFCRFRYLISGTTEMYSAWLLVLIIIDRWIRTRFPYKSKSICTRKTALIAALMTFLIFFGCNTHVLFPFFGMLLPGLMNTSCGPKSSYRSYYSFYIQKWSIIQVILKSFGPTAMMIILIVDIFVKIRAQKRRIAVQTEVVIVHELTRRNKRINNQMIILMLANVVIFFATTLPLTFNKLLASYTMSTLTGLQEYLITSSVFNWLLSLNFAIAFYLYCLTSNLFRKEFLLLFNIRRTRNDNSRTLTHATATIPLRTHR